MADEFQNLNIMYMYDGCSRAWHYDGTDTVITLLLLKPVKVSTKYKVHLSQKRKLQGGEYELAPFIRGKKKGEENFEEVAKLFDGSYDNNIVKDADEGTLNLFNGERYI